MKIAVSSASSFDNGSTSSFFNNPSSMMNSNQKYDSSASSNPILSFEMKRALDCAMQTPR